MGLTLCVGYLADMLHENPAEISLAEESFAGLGLALTRLGLDAHHEPTVLPDDTHFTSQMWGYSGIHALRRFAAYTALGEDLYNPCEEQPQHDARVEDYYVILEENPDAGLPFQHLMLHSDSEGYYVPQDFERVALTERTIGVAGGRVGSSVRLFAECELLARLLDIPDEMDIDNEALWAAADAPSDNLDAPTWQRYGVEAFCCVRLREAARYSLASGAAVVFC